MQHEWGHRRSPPPSRAHRGTAPGRRQLAGTHGSRLAERHKRAQLATRVGHHALFGGPVARQVRAALGRARHPPCRGSRRGGIGLMTLAITVHAAAVVELDGGEIALVGLLALGRSGHGDGAARAEHLLRPARAPQRMRRAHLALPCRHLAASAAHIQVQPGMRVDEVDPRQRAGDGDVAVEVPVGDAMMGSGAGCLHAKQQEREDASGPHAFASGVEPRQVWICARLPYQHPSPER